MAKIGQVEGIGPVFQEKLENAGILTTEALLEKCATAAGRADLATSADIQPKRLMSFVSRADFFRIKGVGRQFGELLQNVDIHTVFDNSRFSMICCKNSVQSDCTRECKESVNFGTDLEKCNC